MNRPKRLLISLVLLAAPAAVAGAQIRLPVIFPLRGSQPAPPPGLAPSPFSTPEALQSDMIAKSGSDTVYFAARGAALDTNAMATLTAQARWLLVNPFVNVRIEGHGGSDDSRDYALAIGDKRANSVRDFLVLQGIAPTRISVLSWGKERPGTTRIGTSVVATGPRTVTIVVPPAAPFPPPVPGQ